MTNLKNQHPTCCFCCHVKVGTFVLAVLVLISGMIGIVMSSLFLTHAIEPEVFLSKSVMDYNSSQTLFEYKRSTLWVGLGNGVFVTIIAFCAMYGLIKSRAGYLLPLFILQLFDFVCTMVYMGSVVFRWEDMKHKIVDCRHMPEDWKKWLENLDDHWLGVIVFAVLFTTVVIKAYLILMVYRAYKHITIQALLRQQRNQEISSIAGREDGKGPIYKPPKYEDIQKVPLVSDMEAADTKPPPYIA